MFRQFGGKVITKSNKKDIKNIIKKPNINIAIGVIFITLISFIAIKIKTEQTKFAILHNKQIVYNIATQINSDISRSMQFADCIVTAQTTGNFGEREKQ